MNYTLLLIFALIGLSLSSYLGKKKFKKEKLVCIIGKDCSKVIESKYGKMFGIDNIVLGILYYLFITLIGLFAILYPIIGTLNEYFLIILTSSGLAFLISIYLSFIQIKILKEFCEYCLASGIINLILFLIVIL